MKKLMIFLMVAIPLVIIILVNFTMDIVVGNVSIAVDRIELDRREITAHIDETISLEATIYPTNATNQEVIWQSTNEEVARVDLDGNVSFVGFGRGYITATAVDGNKTASCYFYVTDSRVHQIELSSPQKEMHVGSNLQLSWEISPYEAENKNVIFSSSDESIAEVDQNGLVTALKIGYVTISVTTEDGGYSDFVNLSVTRPVEDIVLNTSYAITGESTYSIGYQILPSNATNKNVIFQLDDQSIATVNSLGQVSFSRAGQVEVTLTTVDGGFSKTMTVVYTAGYAHSLQLEKYSITATLGDAAQIIDYTVEPSYLTSTEVSFSSSNEDVAYVKDGYLYFFSGGDATITVSVEKAEGVYITEQIAVYVESPATGILIEDVVTADKTVTLRPRSFPENSTNNKFFYHSSSSEVSVNEDGDVTFLTDNPTTATIKIFANKDYSNISTTVSVQYTAGKAKTFVLNQEKIVMDYGSSSVIDYSVFPSNANANAVQVEILSQTSNAGSGQVVEILPDGSLRGIGGGKAQVQVSLVLLDGQKASYELEVEVLREVEDIEILLDLEMQNGEYVTALNTLSFSASCLPADATNKTLTWSLDDKNMGVILGDTLRFNQSGLVKLIATTTSGYSESVSVRYTGSYPISAQVGVLVDGKVQSMPQTLNAGDQFEVAIKEVFPSNSIYRNISLSVSNQQTASPQGKVLTTEGSTITAVAGGKATLTVYVSTTVILTFEINVYQNVDSIEVTPSNITTTNSMLTLQANVLPVDATNKDVVFQVLTPEIAYIEGTSLYFLQNGVAQIVAISKDDPEKTYLFTIEKIAEGIEIVDPTQGEIKMYVGGQIKLDFASVGNDYHHLEIQFAQSSDSDLLSIDGDILQALKKGQCQIICTLYDQAGSMIESYQIAIIIEQLVDDIIYAGELEQYNGYLVTATDLTSLNFDAKSKGEVIEAALNYKITSAYNSNGVAQEIAYIDEQTKTLYWLGAGTLTIEVSSSDGNVAKSFKFRYTGGDALDAQINQSKEVLLNVGDSITIEVTKWTPSDTTNKRILIRETNHTTGVNVVSIDNQNLTITALSGGFSNIRLELSNGLTYDITINVIKKVTSIVVSEENIVTASSSAVINATAYPNSATDKTLSYQIEKVDFARLEGNKVIFSSAGTVVVTISTMDGSNLHKQVSVTSTMGYLSSIALNVDSKTLAKGSSFSLFVTQTYPLDATNKDIHFKILSHSAVGGGQNDVVSISQSGSTILVKGLYGGSAVIRAYSQNSLGEEIFADCTVTVNTPVEGIDIDFEQELQFYQNAYVTSQSKIFFDTVISPADATNREVDVSISNPNIASIEEGVITFKQPGIVTIKFTSTDNTSGEKSVSYIFNYTGDYTLLEANLNLQAFDSGVLRLDAGAQVQLSLESFVPKDNKNVSLSLTTLTEERNDKQKPVFSFENGLIKALNGGQATFTLTANNISLGTYTIVVNRQAADIVVEEGPVYVSSAGYQIQTSVLPTDASNKTLIYSSSDQSIATVDTFGGVSFSGYGTVVITIRLESNPAISKQITIEYTRNIKDISFSAPREAMYATDYVVLAVNPQPIYADDYTYSFTLSDESVASLAQQDELHWVLRGKKAGQVKVTISVDGTDISYSKTFTFYAKITDISLKLDVNDGDEKYGHGKYRVFANRFVDDLGKLSNQYVMEYSTKPSGQDFAGQIEWSSSDEDVATVDQNGVVTIKGSGVVTITAAQVPPYEGANVVWDSYTFYLVDGINVYNFEQYKIAIKELAKINKEKTDNFSALVLHSDIAITDSDFNHSLNYNIYGNGRMIDFSGDKAYNKINITRSNLVIDNVVLRGWEFEDEAALSKLDSKGKILQISNHVTNILIYNTIIENAHVLAEVINSQVTFKGCILRNSFAGGLILNSQANDSFVADVTVEDSIFASSLLSCILFKPVFVNITDKYYDSKLTLIGDVRIYNWLTLDEFEGGSINSFFAEYGLSDIAADIISQIKNIISTNYSQYKYTYNGEDYYMLGVLNLSAKVANLFDFQSYGVIYKGQLNPNFNYVDGQINVAVSLIAFSGELKLNILTLMGNGTPFIRPQDTYEGDTTILNQIVQPRRDDALGF